MIQTKLLWYDAKYGHGVVVADDGTEYYIDDSVLKLPKDTLFRNSNSNIGLRLTITHNTTIRNCRCGKNVRLTP